MRITSSLYILIMCLLCGVSYAQSDTENALRDINKIKREPDAYFYAEATSQTWEEALDNAKTLLSAQLEAWAKQEKEPIDGYIARANDHLFQIKAMRGQLYRAFVYVKRTDMIPYSSNQEIMVIPVSSDSSPTIELFPKQSEVKPLTQDMVDTDIVMKEKKADSDLPLGSLYKEYRLSAEEERMIQVTTFAEVNTYISSLQSNNKVLRYGKFIDMPQDKDCYLFIYNREGQIPAYLHKTNEGYFNLKTKQPDSISNYKGCGAIWYILR